MNGRWFLPVVLCCLIGGVVAQDESSLARQLSLQDYFIIFIVGIVLLNLFVMGINRIFRKKMPTGEQSKFATAVGLLFASFLLAAGSVCLIIVVLSVLAMGAQMAMFEWLVELILFYFEPYSLGFITPLLAGLIVVSFAGVILILLAVYLFMYYQGNPLQSMIASPTSMGQPIKQELAGMRGPEVMNPTITFKVLSWGRDDPVPNAKVVLKQANGTKFYIKTTNIEGVVIFDGIMGYGSEYYAYVDGDEKREKFRVIRIHSA